MWMRTFGMYVNVSAVRQLSLNYLLMFGMSRFVRNAFQIIKLILEIIALVRQRLHKPFQTLNSIFGLIQLERTKSQENKNKKECKTKRVE